MSLKSIGSKVKTGVGELTSVSGMKKTAMWLGIGAAIGAIVAVVLHYIQLFVINKYAAAYAKIDGFGIYPNQTTPALYVEDILLIVISVAMLATKKFWLTIGFVLGWYGSNYLGLYTALGLPQPT